MTGLSEKGVVKNHMTELNSTANKSWNDANV